MRLCDCVYVTLLHCYTIKNHSCLNRLLCCQVDCQGFKNDRVRCWKQRYNVKIRQGLSLFLGYFKLTWPNGIKGLWWYFTILFMILVQYWSWYVGKLFAEIINAPAVLWRQTALALWRGIVAKQMVHPFRPGLRRCLGNSHSQSFSLIYLFYEQTWGLSGAAPLVLLQFICDNAAANGLLFRRVVRTCPQNVLSALQKCLMSDPQFIWFILLNFWLMRIYFVSSA